MKSFVGSLALLFLGRAAFGDAILYHYDGFIESAPGAENPWGLSGDGSAQTQDDGSPFTLEMLIDTAAEDRDDGNPDVAGFDPLAASLVVDGNVAIVSFITFSNTPATFVDDSFDGLFDDARFWMDAELFGVRLPVNFEVRIAPDSFELSDAGGSDAPPSFGPVLPTQFGAIAADNFITYPAPQPVSGLPDADVNFVADVEDNCLVRPNEDQRDTNLDGIGNACDADLNDDCAVNFVDLGELKEVFYMADPDADFDGDGGVNFVNLGIMKEGFFLPPGPSGIPNACSL